MNNHKVTIKIPQEMKITPDWISELKPNEIMVFGSNLAGIHGKGAARVAYMKFGAVYGSATGIQGKSYAIPTKDYHLRVLSLEEIKKYVDDFLDYAIHYPEKEFFVSAIGTGLAGYKPKDIALMFKEVPSNVSLPQSFWDVLIVNKK